MECFVNFKQYINLAQFCCARTLDDSCECAFYTNNGFQHGMFYDPLIVTSLLFPSHTGFLASPEETEFSPNKVMSVL